MDLSLKESFVLDRSRTFEEVLKYSDTDLLWLREVLNGLIDARQAQDALDSAKSQLDTLRQTT